MLLFYMLIVACLLALTLIIVAIKRISKEGLTVTDTRQHFVRSVEDVKRQLEQERKEASITEKLDEAGSIFYSSHGFGKCVDESVENAALKVEVELSMAGIHVIDKIDINKLLGRVNKAPYFSIIFCDRKIAVTALETDPSLGLLQFTAIIRKDFDDTVKVEFMDPVRVVKADKLSASNQAALNLKETLIRILNSF
ncbi:MAG: hypothetical protein CO186_03760 [Zetaproteobacteria bacterium CG_4_9_14_3_um_filter_49_83]|nr:MAG: hypothetical protein AUJ56_01440 [Zetaproteobacteria bacterium CG1_02_49_23]PIQ31002.1 MAG: hypothetical protein COW62_10765 [Zetaproteobacteria bacterium CG17_big_fil_post_rev_8_21_14_2_50_50_13]PIY56887.1 MAG: hypothetical protein COZ00_01755 [Zetaproteobacteria bacterium CG_4_10_14_0_8_um_filter_49_80]PJA35857.1 MAG: hypothetical protein CO186_03760 [Zetaproteobacteria bacterium CG_4_9_14_3_um_filter_49_83]